ncbi:MAG: hypothetical protein JWM27_81 [Gemmatimonadetes bacterium]|nr:hypothetical protein [Gemmatimonadota bacterium]
MSALTLTAAGLPNWTVPVASCSPLAPEMVGTVSRSLAGTLLSDVTVRKRGWKVTTAPMARAAADAGLLLLYSIPITATGDIPGGTLTCLADVEAGGMIGRGPGEHLVTVVFTLREA